MRRQWLTLLVPLLLAGCQPAVKYGGKPAPGAAAKPPAPPAEAAAPDPTLTWANPLEAPLEDVPIVFVHEADGDEWSKLPAYWNAPAAQAATVIGLGPSLAPPVTDAKPAVRVKVPAGLDDPRSASAAYDYDPPTLRKWELGRRLFFNATWLTDTVGVSCATCHVPKSGFAENVRGHDGGAVNTPTLVNCLFNRRQFWDGRAASLEEVVQQTPADETAPAADKGFRHAWPGVVGRLRKNEFLNRQFKEAFGVDTTQDALGRVLAAYLRTLLAGDSLYDRARAAAKGKDPEAAHFVGVLDDAALKALGREGKKKEDVAAELAHGCRLFFNQDKVHKANCVDCHGGREFTDGRFHNLGVGWESPDPAHYTGYFPHAPLGQKDRALIGAFKTPTLRGLSRTGPYFHDGSAATLEAAVEFHVVGGAINDYLDPKVRDLGLSKDEVQALVVFLKALNGEPVDAAVSADPFAAR